MPLYLSTAWSECIHKELRPKIEEFVAKGITRIELSGGSVYQETIEADLIQLQQEHHLEYVVHNYFPPVRDDFVLNIASPEPTDRKRSIEFVKQSIALASKIGSPLYTIHAGYAKKLNVTSKGYFKPEEASQIDWAEIYRNFYNSLEEILPFAQEHNVRVGIENLFPFSYEENYSIMCTLDKIEELLERYRSNPYVGILLDLGHLNVSAHYLRFDRDQVIETLVNKYRDKIFEIHISENDGSGDSHLPIEIDSWQMNVVKKYNLSDKPIIIEGRDLSYDLIKHISGIL